MGLLLLLMATVCAGQGNTRFTSLGELVGAEYLHEAISYYTDIKGELLGMTEFRMRVQNYVDEVRSMGYDIPVYYNDARNGWNNTAILNYRVWFNDLGYILPANHRELSELRTDGVQVERMVKEIQSYAGSMTDVAFADSMLIDSMLRASAVGRVSVTNPLTYRDTMFLSPYERATMAGSVNVSPTSVHFLSLHQLMLEYEDRTADDQVYYARKVRQTMPLDELQFHRDTSWAQRGRLIAKGRFAYRMWVEHDAIPSHKADRQGATLNNGGSWALSLRHTPVGKALKREVMGKYGADIPFLGWDEQVYIDHYATHSVFGPVRKDAVAKAKSMSYRYSPGSAKDIRKMKRKSKAGKRRGINLSDEACKKSES